MTSTRLSALDDAVVLSEWSRGHPVSIGFELELDGRLDHDALVAAVARVLEAYPRAGARLGPSSRRSLRQHWLDGSASASDVVSRLVAADDDDLVRWRGDFVSRPFDTCTGPLVRIAHVTGESDRLLVSAHHGLADARAWCRFLEQVAAAFEHPPSSRELRPRIPLGIDRPLPDGADEGESSKWWRRSPGRIGADGGRALDGYGVAHQKLRRPGPDAGRPQVTVNDLLVTAAGRTAERWNLDQGLSTSAVTVTMPVASSAAPTDPWITNSTGQASIEVPVGVDGPSAIAAVSRQTSVVRLRRSADEPGAALGGAGILPLVVRRRLPPVFSRVTRDRLIDTTRLSNLGRLPLLTFGPVGVTRWWFTPPVRDPQGVVLGAATIDDVVYLAARWTRHCFDQSAGERFIAGFASTYDELVGDLEATSV